MATLDQPDATLVEIPLNRMVVQAMRQIDRREIPELPDRIVASTAVYLNVPVISRDGKIQASKVQTIW